MLESFRVRRTFRKDIYFSFFFCDIFQFHNIYCEQIITQIVNYTKTFIKTVSVSFSFLDEKTSSFHLKFLRNLWNFS